LKLPNLFIAGAQKSGTTWLARCLGHQSCAFLPREKELHFFNTYSEITQESLHNYSARYANSNARWNIDATPNYLCTPGVEKKVSATCPDAKIIVTLRNPVERSISATRHHLARRRFPSGTTSDSILNNIMDGHEDTWEILSQGDYIGGLTRWFSVFPRERFHIVIFEEDIAADKGMMALSSTAEFLGESRFNVPMGHTQFKSPTPTSRLAGVGMSHFPFLARLQGGLNCLVSSDREFQVSQRTRQKLHEWFAPQVQALPELISRRPINWGSLSTYYSRSSQKPY